VSFDSSLSEAVSVEQFYSPLEVADLLGLNRKAIYKAIDEGELAAHKLRGRVRIPRSSLESWIERNRV
jgi:excisionase family DNA binding protein